MKEKRREKIAIIERLIEKYGTYFRAKIKDDLPLIHPNEEKTNE